MNNTAVNTPLVSVVLPVFNAERSIRRTLDALLAQTYSTFEVLCVNDGSTDSTAEILADYSKEYPEQVRIISQENAGAYKARIAGIKAATGDFIAFCDADDLPRPRMLETMIERTREADADMVVCAYERVNSIRRQTEMAGFGDETRTIDKNSGWLVQINTALWNKLFTRDALEQVINLPEPPKATEDALLLFSVYPTIKRISFVSEPLYTYVERTESIMQTIDPEQLPSLFRAWEQERQGLPEDFLPIYDLAAFVHLGISIPVALSALPKEDLHSYWQAISLELDAMFPLHNKSAFLKRSYTKQHPGMNKITLAHAAHMRRIMPYALKTYDRLRDLLPIGIAW